MATSPFAVEIKADWQGLLRCIRREGTPDRVYFMETDLDPEVQQTICDRYGLLKNDVGPDDPFFEHKRNLAVQRFLGYDYVCCGLDNVRVKTAQITTEDTAVLQRKGGRVFLDAHTGPITTWEEFESFSWPDPEDACTRSLEWYSKNLPEDMCIIGIADVAHLLDLMGYERLCYALHDQRDLVAAINKSLQQIYAVCTRRILEFDRVKLLLEMDDMGFKSGTLISPDDLREFVLPDHKAVAEISHAAGRPYLLHSCGKLDAIMEDLIEEVGIDAKHSFEDVIERVEDAKAAYGERIALLGGIDVDVLCRASEEQIRCRVDEVLKKCMPGGGYCLGTGNSVTNYIPVDNYLAMLDQGRKFVP